MQISFHINGTPKNYKIRKHGTHVLYTHTTANVNHSMFLQLGLTATEGECALALKLDWQCLLFACVCQVVCVYDSIVWQRPVMPVSTLRLSPSSLDVHSSKVAAFVFQREKKEKKLPLCPLLSLLRP